MDETEKKFEEWLERKEIPYWYIHQDIDTFSEALKKLFGKRPDFMILIPNFTFILVDVKFKEPSKKFPEFQIDYDETKKYSNLQRLFNLPVWYALSYKKAHYKTWYWIPVSEVLERGNPFPFDKEKKEYYGVGMENFYQMSVNDDLGHLFMSMLKK